MTWETTGAANPVLLGGESLTFRAEWRSIYDVTVDGSPANLNGTVQNLSGAPQVMWRVMAGSGDATPLILAANFRKMWNFDTALGAASRRIIFRPYLNGINSLGWSDVFPALAGSAIAANVARPPAVTISAWIRKNAAGGVTDAKRGIGFGSNIVIAPSAGVPMCGLFGDGVQGFRFGSIGCPDGAGAGEIAQSAIDANSVQPAELVSPGANWFHVKVKLIPPAPGIPGIWAAYLNGQLIRVYSTLTNFPRGGGGVSAGREFFGVEPGIYAYADAARAITSFLVWDARVRIADDWSV